MNRLFRLLGVAVFAIAMLSPASGWAQTGPDTDPGTDTDTVANDYGNDSIENQKTEFVGLTGGILVGGELVVAIEGLAGVDKLWPYLTFPFLGAAGGGVGGYFLGDASAGGAVALLVVGMAAIIPTAMAAASAMAYDPEEEGALESDAEEQGKYSFEQSPSGVTAEGGTSTEVESKPDTTPPGQELPPPGADVPPPEPEAEAPPAEAEPAPETAPETEETSSNDSTRSERRRKAMIRRARAGSLFYVDNDGSAGLSMPHVGVRPTRVSKSEALLGARSGIEVMVPVLRIDLP